MNILRKFATLIRAMTTAGTVARPVAHPRAEADDGGITPAAKDAQRAIGTRSEAQGQPLDRSRVADLLDQQTQGQDRPARRPKGDRS